jgi:hypothetical protein
MFADKIDSLRGLVVNRERVIHQKNLDRRRWSVRRAVMRDVKDSFLPALEAAIGKSHSDYGHTVVLRTYSVAEWTETDCDDISLGEVFEKTDVLERVANCLAPGFFKCHVRPTIARQRMRARVYEIVARFYAGGIEAEKPPCTCVCSYLTDGFCDVCGGHNVHDLNRYPRKDNWREGDDWICASCNHLHEQPLTHCFNCKKPRQERQINNPEDEESE